MHRYSPALMEEIRALRVEGLTYKEINARLKTDIPKASMTYICRNIEMSEDYHARMLTDAKQRLAFVRGLALKKNKELLNLRIKKVVERAKFADNLVSDKRVATIALAMLYLGEGSKWKSRRGLMLGSADPRIIKIYLTLLERCYGLDTGGMRARIQHRADQSYQALQQYWQRVTGFSTSQFYPGYVDKRTVGSATKKENYHGVCVITGPGADVQLELDAIADIIYEGMGH